MRTRRTTVSPPCLTADILETWMEADRSSIGFPTMVAPSTSSRYLSGCERLMAHLLAFLMGSCSLLMIDVARDPGVSWSLAVIGIWASALVLHAVLYLVRSSGAKRRAAFAARHETPRLTPPALARRTPRDTL